ncbi:MAG: type III polyketide synthase [Phycisphaerales bacterium]|jgi:alpha-pyrone synthase
MTARMLGIGTATPRGRLDQAAAAEMVAAIGKVTPARARAMSHLYAQSGIDERAMAIVEGEGQTYYNGSVPDTAHRMRSFHVLAPPIAHEACTQAIQRSVIDAREVTHLVTASCTGLASPGVDISLIGSLGLDTTVQRVNIGFMGCHAALNALRTARAIALAEPGARVLVCCVELCSLHIQASQQDGCSVADALFADGAAACVVAGGGGGSAPSLRRTASILLPDSLGAMGWRIGEAGFTMTLSPAVPDILSRSVCEWVDGLLATEGLQRADIAAWAIHPGGPRVLASVADALGLDDGATRASGDVLRRHGNMSSATILFIIAKLLEEHEGGPLLALAFGPGLTGEALLMA